MTKTKQSRQGKRTDQYGDPNYAGAGKIKCHICGEPVRDHKISEPCPELGLEIGETLTVGKIRSRR